VLDLPGVGHSDRQMTGQGVRDGDVVVVPRLLPVSVQVEGAWPNESCWV
jgi:hypothetical protein